ncbi:MAG TPA: penicillin-binding protein 2 [Solirubrobacteraceae bacterium]|jgi:cell division protein FtsI (penicillin-binding protein 3)|nr:penicillin-binding protein 2 [Solirubrobacteraceae bacterium]
MATIQRRVGLLFGLFFALLLLAGARALYLGGPHSGALRRAARSQQLTYEVVPAERGTITDRNGVALAISEPAQEISADPYLIKAPLTAARSMAPLLGLSQAQVLTKLSEHTGFVYLARALPYEAAHKLLALKIPGVQGAPVMRRVYPRGTLAAQVIGIVGTEHEGAGVSGLEYSRNSMLAGHAGRRRVVSDAIGQPVSIAETQHEQSGASISLTLDANIQQRAEDVLSAAGRIFHPKDSTAIVMDPRTGAILAMANWPLVNANHPGASAVEALQNRAVGFNYEPGSTFKAITVSGALQEGLITPNTGFEIPDQIQVADRTIHDDTEHPGESLTTSQILAQSSNVGAIKIGLLEGKEKFNSWVHRFGFGSPTGVDLPGDEGGATLPLDRYSGSSMGNLPIGQGELVTPIQMATAYSAIANGGILRPPHIIDQVGGHRVAEPAGKRVISQTTAGELRNMLKGVLAPGGTASEVSIHGYELAGKTGTASKIDPQTGEYSKSAYVASFVGFAPASDPKLLCAVIIDEPQTGSIYGGVVAAPAFGQIMEFALPYLDIPPG